TEDKRVGGGGGLGGGGGDGWGVVRPLGVLPLGGAHRGARRRAAAPLGSVAQQAAHRRVVDVLHPVPDAGRPVLRCAALPLGVPRLVGSRDRRAAAPALPDAPPRRDPDSAAPAPALPTPPPPR